MTIAADSPDAMECDLDTSQLDDLAQALPAKALQALLASFHESFEIAYEQLKSATALRDLGAAGGEAHDLKSITGNFGMRRLQHLAERIEHACKGGDADTVVRLVPEVAAAWATARILLDGFKVEEAA
jgi:HPt (histidine-containing phosphotransfer) domain-containing protein